MDLTLLAVSQYLFHQLLLIYVIRYQRKAIINLWKIFSEPVQRKINYILTCSS